MTRKDFELIAKTLKAQAPGYGDSYEYEVWECMVQAFAKALKTTNAPFKRDVFLKACGVSP